MSSNPHTRDDAEQFPEVVAGLDRLAERIDRRRYPGVAWQGPQPRGRRVIYRIGLAAAAAAAVLVLAAVVYQAPQGPAAPGPTNVVAASTAGEEALLAMVAAAVEQSDDSDYELTYVSDVLFDIYDPSPPEGTDETLEPASLTPDWWDLADAENGQDS